MGCGASVPDGTHRNAVRNLQTVVRGAAAALPFPGQQTASMLFTLLYKVELAKFNKDNLETLSARACDLIQAVQLSIRALQDNGSYKHVVTRFTDLLTELDSYAEVFASRSWITYVVSADGLISSCREFNSRIDELRDDVASAAPAADKRSKLMDVMEHLKRPVMYQDHCERLRQVLLRKGGMAAVQQDKAAMIEVMAELNQEHTMTALVVEHALAVWDATRDSDGVQSSIRNPDLRLLWRKYLRYTPDVPWEQWWAVFPARLHDLPLREDYVDQVEQLLASDSARRTFREAVEDWRAPDRLGVTELQRAFPECADLLVVVQAVLGAAPPQPPPSEPTVTSVHESLTGPPPIELPQEEPLYGRDEEAQQLLAELQERRCRAMCLVGSSGVGKTRLAMLLGKRLWESGACPGGVSLVELRQVTSWQDVLGQFRHAFHIAGGGQGFVGWQGERRSSSSSAGYRTSSQLGGRPRSVGARQLLLVDNAEDAVEVLDDEGGHFLAQLLAKILAASEDITILVATRIAVMVEGVEMQLHGVGSISEAASRQLLSGIAPDLSQEQLTQMSTACRGVPLRLKLMADSVTSGRSGIPDLSTLDMADEGAVIAAALRTLPRTQQLAIVQLSIFPSTFDEASTAAALGSDMPTARGVLRVLCAHSLIWHGPQSVHSTPGAWAGSFVVHAGVQSQAIKLPGAEELRAHAVERFAEHAVVRLRHLAEAGDVPKASMGSVSTTLPNVNSQPPSSHHLDQQAQQVDEDGLETGTESTAAGAYLSNLAGSFHAAGKLSEAEQLYRQALEMDIVVLGSETTTTAAYLNNLAACLHAEGKYAEAEPLYRQALEVRTRRLGQDHPDTADTMYRLGGCLLSQGKHVEAEPLYRQALAVCIAHNGPEHPDVASILTNLAACIYQQGRYGEAEQHFERALDIRARKLPSLDELAVESLGNLAACYQAQGKDEDAEDLFRRAMDARMQTLGLEHPDTAAAISRLAACRAIQGRLAESELLYQQALNVCEHQWGPDHAVTVGTLASLASVIEKQGKFGEAEPLFERVLNAHLGAALGTSDRDMVIEPLNRLAACLQSQGKQGEAQLLYQQAVNILTRQQGVESLATAASLDKLAGCMSQQGRHGSAELLLRQAVNVRTRLLGANHPESVAAAISLARCLRDQGKREDAKPLYWQALYASCRLLS